MGIEKIYDHLPKSKEGRTVVGLLLVCVGLFTSAALLTIILIPLGIAVLAFDHEWARNILRKVRDWLNNARQNHERRRKDRQES